MQGSANSNIFETLCKGVTSHSNEKRIKKRRYPSGLSHYFQHILWNCVNVNGSPF